MKRLVFLFFIVGFAGSFANKQDENYYKASKLFREGKYHESHDLYTQLTPQGSITYYNTGVVLYHLQQYVDALVAWRTAQLGASYALMKKIFFNCKQVQTKLGLAHDTFWYQFLFLLHARTSLLFFQLLFLISWFGMFVGGYFLKSKKTVIKSFLFCVALSSFFVVGVKYWIAYTRFAIVVSEGAYMFAGPNSDFHTIDQVKLGQQLKVVGEEESWYKVVGNHQRGWLKKQYAKEIKT